MILVTVGMHTQPFDRLVRAADELASLGNERVIIQRGASGHVPQFAQYLDSVDEAQIQIWLAEARAVVSHAGAGSILAALQAGKPLVLVPRMARFDEHFDDHQFELAWALAERGQAITVTDLSAQTLAEAIAQAMQLQSRMIAETGLHTFLRAWLAGQAVVPPSKRLRTFRR